MKKVFIGSSVALLALVVLSSCKKDYTCVCTFTGGTTLNIDIKDAKKKDAESSCAAAETTYKGADPGASCSI